MSGQILATSSVYLCSSFSLKNSLASKVNNTGKVSHVHVLFTFIFHYIQLITNACSESHMRCTHEVSEA